MATKRGDRINKLVKEVEDLAKRIRTELRKMARQSGLPRELERAGIRLRKQAAAAAGQVEKYVHELRMELQGKKVSAKRTAAKPRRAPAKRKKTAPAKKARAAAS